MNKVQIDGFVLKDPEMGYTPSNKRHAKLLLGRREKYQSSDKEHLEIHAVISLESLAIEVEKNVKKGYWVEVTGSLRSSATNIHGSYRKTEILATEIKWKFKAVRQEPKQSEKPAQQKLPMLPYPVPAEEEAF